jgi:hypothetical protein
VERLKNELHERDDRELERAGQPLCIYEPFLGEGTWPFLHQSSLYRGIGLVSYSCNNQMLEMVVFSLNVLKILFCNSDGD